METTRHTLLASAALFALATVATAQVAQLSPPALPNDVPISINLVPNGTNLKAIVSMSKNSRQVRVDVTGAPVVGGSVTFTRDQYCDAIYTPVFGGHLITGHRFGGLRAWKATPSTLPLTQTDFHLTNYSHEGLKTFKDMVLYSEQHTSPTSQGGLELWRLDSTGGLHFVGQKLFTAGAGNALEVDRSGRVVWQWGDRNNDKYDGVLRVYSTNGYTGNPILLSTIPHPYVKPYYSKDLELNAQGINLLGAMGWDGLRAINVTNPTSPVINTIIPPTNIVFVDGVTFVPGSNYAVMWGLVRFGTIDIDFISLLDASVPGSASLVWIAPVKFRVNDIKVRGTTLYCVGQDRVHAMRPILVKF